MSNMDLWNSVFKTPPSETKAITGKPYQGTSPKPMYLVKKATETFGPCGIGWGVEVVSERVEEGAGGDKVHIAHVRVWYMQGDKRGVVEHVGQTMFSGTRNNGKTYTDEDAPKKSVTDAMVKALSLIGFAGDIFMGRYDDSKYLNDLRAEERAAHSETADNPSLDIKAVVADLVQTIDHCPSLGMLNALKRQGTDFEVAYGSVPESERSPIKAAWSKRRLELSKSELQMAG